MHQADIKFIDNTLKLFDTQISYKTSQTTRRIKCVIDKPPKIPLHTLKQITLMNPCNIAIDVADKQLSIDFYKHGETTRNTRQKRKRDREIGTHPFKVKTHPKDQPVIDQILNILCSDPNICMFDVTCTKNITYDLEIQHIEAIPYTLLEEIQHKLSTFIEYINIDFPNQTIHFIVKRNDSL